MPHGEIRNQQVPHDANDVRDREKRTEAETQPLNAQRGHLSLAARRTRPARPHGMTNSRRQIGVVLFPKYRSLP
jgi:hypothetical protein